MDDAQTTVFTPGLQHVAFSIQVDRDEPDSCVTHIQIAADLEAAINRLIKDGAEPSVKVNWIDVDNSDPDYHAYRITAYRKRRPL